jgi:hypothetical protein
MKPSGSIRPETRAVVEIGRQRQLRDSLVRVRWTPGSSSGRSFASATISGNQGQGTMTRARGDEALAGKLEEGAVVAAVDPDVVEMRDHEARARGLAQHGGEPGLDRLSPASPRGACGALLRARRIS